MSNVIEFRFRKTDTVVLRGGIIIKSTVASEVGQFRYFVDVIEADGTEIGLWDGASYYDAVLEARDIAVDWGGAPVRDLTDEGRA
jgi:hypothetical protein